MGVHADDAMFQAIDYMIAEGEHKIREENWDKGIHTDIYGKDYNIKQMSSQHIKNTIKFFKIYDTNHSLYKELNYRGINWKIIN